MWTDLGDLTEIVALSKYDWQCLASPRLSIQVTQVKIVFVSIKTIFAA
jgi:hypothetical protein